jgi:energy-coupling factor transporter ATP-binding protein EcfA2
VDSRQARAPLFPVIRAPRTGARKPDLPFAGGEPADSVLLPLIALQPEQKRVETALRKGESLLVLGPKGCGKTRLLRECSLSVSGTAFVQYSASFHLLLQGLALALMEAGHTHISRCVPGGVEPAKWLSKQTSVHLRGILWKALEKQPARIVLDGIDSSSFPVLRFFQRIYFVRGMSIVASARDAFALGALGRIFWDPRKTLQLKSLNDAASAELFETVARHYGIAAANMGNFRERALGAAAGNGGQIVEMCRLASKPEYLSASGKIKFELVRIDSLVRTMG